MFSHYALKITYQSTPEFLCCGRSGASATDVECTVGQAVQEDYKKIMSIIDRFKDWYTIIIVLYMRESYCTSYTA